MVGLPKPLLKFSVQPSRSFAKLRTHLDDQKWSFCAFEPAGSGRTKTRPPFPSATAHRV